MPMPATGQWPPARVLVFIAVILIVLTCTAVRQIEHNDPTTYTIIAFLHAAFYLGAVWWVWRWPPRAGDLLLIVVIALVLRAIAMTAPANLSTDGLRYVWDGRIQWAGFNPYLLVPADERLAFLRDALIYPGINQKETAVTIYPPAAQMVFLIANRISDSLSGVQLVMAAFELVIIAAVIAWLKAAGQPLERAVIYAWHPLPIWEFASQAHIDSAATALLMLTIVAVVHGRQGVAGGLLAAAVLTKYFPLVLFPALWRRWSWRLPLAFLTTVAVLYAPYAVGTGTGVIGFLRNHLDNEGYVAGYGFHIVWVLRDFGFWAPSGQTYVALALPVLAALGLWALLRRRADEVRPEHLVVLSAAFVFATSPHYAWYFGWLVPLLARYPSPAVLGFTLLALMWNIPGSTSWASQTLFYTVIYGGFLILVAGEVIWRWHRREQ